MSDMIIAASLLSAVVLPAAAYGLCASNAGARQSQEGRGLEHDKQQSHKQCLQHTCSLSCVPATGRISLVAAPQGAVLGSAACVVRSMST